MTKPKTGQTFACEHCGLDFYRPASFIAARKKVRFCSKSCLEGAISAGTFKRGPADGERPYRRNGEMLSCAVCGTSYYRKASEISNGVNKTCSVNCRNKYLSGERNHFSGQFIDIPQRPPQWTKTQRKEWLDIKCARCGSMEKLELDHVIPRGPNTRENCQTLCRSCNQRKCWNEDRIHYRGLP